MAFGRSNSLSLNTGATNSLFAQQQQSQAPAGNSLFNTANTTNQTSNLFGGTNNAAQPNQPTSLFGNTNNNAQTNQPANTSSLFGGASNTQQSQPAGSTSLFGGASNTQQSQPAGSTSLFGGASNTQQSQPAGTTGLFSNQPSLFGNTSTSNNMFANPPKPAPTGLFGAPVNPTASTTGGGLFSGASSTQKTPSLLGATQHAQMNQSNPFGRLSMGQSAGTTPQAASQVTVDNLRPTTRFEDCADNVKQELMNIDKMIQAQEGYARQIEAFLLKHDENVQSLQPDITLIKDKTEDVEQSLASGARGVDAQRQLTEKDKKDFQRIERVATNLTLPQGYQYPNMGLSGFSSMYGSQQRPQQPQTAPEGEDPSNYDTDLIGNYFMPLASELQQTMTNYASTLTEIESHIRVIEESTIAQAQQLAQRGAGLGGQTNEGFNVGEIVSTLRIFEGGILEVAGDVGRCREGVNQLVLGRLNQNGY